MLVAAVDASQGRQSYDQSSHSAAKFKPNICVTIGETANATRILKTLFKRCSDEPNPALA
jgi:hypothetical protein